MIYSIYLKLTDRCNLSCKHCYNATKSQCQVDMSLRLIDQAIVFIKEQYKDKIVSKNDQLIVIFHGGEPLLADINNLKYVVQELSIYPQVRFSITTNLICDFLKEPDKLEFLKQNFSTISTSWDYLIRFSHNQESIWENNIKILQENGINPVPIITLTSLLITNFSPTSLCQFLSGLKLTEANIERLTLTGRAVENDLMPLNRDIDEYCSKLYTVSKKYNLEFKLLRGLEETINNQQLIGCRCRNCQKTVLTINPDGSIAGCPNTAHSGIFGDIYTGIDINRFKDAFKREAIRDTACYLCEYYQYCNGECFQLLHDKSGCPGLKQTIKKILEEKK